MPEEFIIPIFPLPVVACPTEFVPLHIFEERYKEMVAFCLDQDAMGKRGEFAIFLSRDDEVASIGTTVRIRQVLREHADGRLDILTVAQQRCRLGRRIKEHAYDTAAIEWVGDEDHDWDEELATEAFSCHRTLIELVTGSAPDDESYGGIPELSFYLAQTAGLTVDEKQTLLELRSENERVRRLAGYIQARIEVLQRAQIAAQSIQGSWEMQQSLRKRPAD
jgi:Lon protease-like protein